MNGREAIKIDTEFYAELDDDSGLFCVFGDNSDFAYSSYADKEEAKKEADRMNEFYSKAARS